MSVNEETPFTPLSELVHAHAQARPADEALCDEVQRLTWAQLDARIDRVAASLQRDGLIPGDAVALWAGSTVETACLFLGALRAGAAVAPLSPSVTPQEGRSMLADAGARWVFLDDVGQALWERMPPADGGALHGDSLPSPRVVHQADLSAWLAPEGTVPQHWLAEPEDPFNIIYSSGTTGTPKGIVQPHGMRWMHVRRGMAYGYGPHSRTLLSTPLYSNTTLVAFMPTLGLGGCMHLMPRFDAARWLQRAQAERITHTMLVPVQYRRLLEHAAFDGHDLSSLQMKFCTSAPFSADLKRRVLRRMPGGLVEFYGMTEGGGTCILEAHHHPDKLHTVGQPSKGHDVRLIDEEGQQVWPAVNAADDEAVIGSAAGSHASTVTGEVVGRSPAMMTGYHGQPQKTREAEWYDDQGQRFIRTGDVGRFDEDGFLILFDRRKDMVISGGFNLYPSDLEALLMQHPAVAEAAVVGVASARWGETPVAWVVRRQSDSSPSESSLLEWFNARCGKTQRLAGLAFIDELPRSAIGKVLKRELRDRWQQPVV